MLSCHIQTYDVGELFDMLPLLHARDIATSACAHIRHPYVRVHGRCFRRIWTNLILTVKNERSRSLSAQFSWKRI